MELIYYINEKDFWKQWKTICNNDKTNTNYLGFIAKQNILKSDYKLINSKLVITSTQCYWILINLFKISRS
mgnify:CR=1 FL=1